MISPYVVISMSSMTKFVPGLFRPGYVVPPVELNVNVSIPDHFIADKVVFDVTCKVTSV